MTHAEPCLRTCLACGQPSFQVHVDVIHHMRFKGSGSNIYRETAYLGGSGPFPVDFPATKPLRDCTCALSLVAMLALPWCCMIYASSPSFGLLAPPQKPHISRQPFSQLQHSELHFTLNVMVKVPVARPFEGSSTCTLAVQVC